MKKIFIVLAVTLTFVLKINAQAYVKFAEPPAMVLKSQRQYSNYRIEFKSTTASTIYLELKKGDHFIANGVYDIGKPSTNTIVLGMTVFRKIDKLPAGDDYSYNLYMYEGGRNNWSKKACKTVVVDKVRVVDKKSKKSIWVNTLVN